MSGDPLWWALDEERAIERIEKAIEGKADDQYVRLPLGDAPYEKVSDLRARADQKRSHLAQERLAADERSKRAGDALAKGTAL